MKAFVTGGAGFLGSWIVTKLLETGHEVESCDNFTGGYHDNVSSHSRHRFGISDITSSRWLLMDRFNGCDVVYHCACLPHEGLSVFSPQLIAESVFTGSMSVMSAACQARVRRVVNCSSMARYGKGNPPFRETHTTAPVDPYGIAKVAAEQAMTALGIAHGVEVAHAVPHNLIGARQCYTDPYRNVVAIMVNRMLRGIQPIIFGDGQQVRCFSHVDDALFALLRLADCELEQNGEVFNIGPDEGEVTILELARRIASQLGFQLAPNWQPPRSCEVKHAVCSSDKIRARFGYQTRKTLDDGIADVIAYVRQRGPRSFDYNRVLEIMTDKTPTPWVERAS